MDCAKALARHVRSGNADQTPWPFRVDGRTGEVRLGEEYGGMIVAPVRLLDELVRLNAGNVPRFREVRDAAWNWKLSAESRESRLEQMERVPSRFSLGHEGRSRICSCGRQSPATFHLGRSRDKLRKPDSFVPLVLRKKLRAR